LKQLLAEFFRTESGSEHILETQKQEIDLAVKRKKEHTKYDE
jgi:hypothetical protein